MIISKTFKCKHAIILTEDYIKDLVILIANDSKIPQITTSIKDGSYISFDTLDELIKYKNFSQDRLKTLKISNDFITLYVCEESFVFPIFNFDTTIECNWTGDSTKEKDAFEQKINRMFQMFKAPYWFFSKFKIITVLIFWASILITLYGFIFKIDYYFSESINLNILFLTTIFLCLIIWIERNLCKWLFPSIVFKYGEEIKNYESKKMLRNNIIWAIAIPIIIGFFFLLL